MDENGDLDKANLIDGGNGYVESLGFMLDQDVYIDLISEFGSSDSGYVTIESKGSFALVNGVNVK